MRYSQRTKTSAAAAGLLLLFTASSNAATATIFSNFGSNFSFTANSGLWVGQAASPGSPQIVAMKFVPTTNAQFADAILAIGEYAGPDATPGVTHTAHIYLMSDASGLPGTILEQIDVYVTGPMNSNLVTATSVSKPNLSAGTPYWLVANATVVTGPANAQLYWNANSIGDTSAPGTLCNYCAGPTNAAWLSPQISPALPRTAFQIDGITANPQYGVCLLYDATKAVQSGATIPIKLQLCDGNGNDVSSSTVTLHASSITKVSDTSSNQVQESGNANPDSDFRFDATLGATGGYIFNLSTKGLATGTYNLNFTVTGNSFIYAAPFQVR